MTSLDIHFGRHMRNRRDELSISLSALSDLTGIHEEILTSYEAGELCAIIEHMFLLSRALDVSIVYFYKGMMGEENEADGEENKIH